MSSIKKLQFSDGEEYDDGRSYNSEAVRSINQKWFDDHMKNRVSEFTKTVNASIFCGTWNVNAKKHESSLNEWLLPQAGYKMMADVYVIGFQEIVDLNAINVALDSSKTLQRAQFWRDKISECLNPTIDHGYHFIMDKFLVGLFICIFVRSSIAPHVKDVRSAHLGVGIMGMMGNKGGVSIRLNLYDSSICFVCSHLAAHRENIEGRNSDYKNIIERTIFLAEGNNNRDQSNDEPSGPTATVIRRRHGASNSIGVDLTILDHEVIFWLGDLNYRIDEDMTTEEVFELLDKASIASLRVKDQLNIERKKGAVFRDFEEGELTFMPTYKYQPGTDEYERRAEKKLRAPAWCDRILWKVSENDKDSVRQLNYLRAGLQPSDHKPVSSLFDCNLRIVVTEQEDAVYQDLLRKLQFWNNDQLLPTVEVSGLLIDLDSVQYEVPSDSYLKITNVGNTLAHWRFVPKLADSRMSKPWVKIDCPLGLLFPNESVNVKISVNVDKRTSQLINTAKETLDDVLMLRVENSKDFFVAVTAEFQRSCYGMSLEELVYTLVPVRQTRLPGANTMSIAADDSTANSVLGSGSAVKLSVPKELWRLVDALWSLAVGTGEAVREKDMFGGYADPIEVAAIRNALDCGLDFPVQPHACSTRSFAQALVSFLQALPRPIVPTDMCPTSEVEAHELKAWCRKFLESLPPLNYNVFVYVLSFMREILHQSSPSPSSSSSQQLSMLCISCMTNLITTQVMDEKNKEEKTRRETKQRAMQKAIEFMLLTASL